MVTRASDFDQLESLFEQFNRRQQSGRAFRASVRQSIHLRRLSRRSPLAKAAVSTASILGEALFDQWFSADAFSGNGGLTARRPQSTQQTPPFGGSNTASGLGDIFSQASVQVGLANVFAGLLEGLLGGSSNKTRTRTSTSESSRSIDAASRWSTSRSQQEAEVARMVNRGLGQL